MKKLLMAGLLMGLAIGVGYSKNNEVEKITATEKISMLNEADDFIDEIPEGSSDRQADAVLHALQGSAMELAALRESRDAAPAYSDNVEVREITPMEGPARGIKMRLYMPKSSERKELPLLVYLHGGGWTIGSLNSCGAFCDALAATGEVAVLAVEYSLAPESTFPGGLSDCLEAVDYAFANAEELGTTPELISLGGDSSGGNLAVAAALYRGENKNGNEEALRSLALYYPVVDIKNENVGTWKDYSRGYGLDRRLMDAFIMAYDDRGRAPEFLGNIPSEVLKSPVKATEEQLRKLPPVLMISAERDILADQGKSFAEKMKEAGNVIERIEFPGAVHLFITVAGQPTAFRKAVELTVDYLKRY